MSRRIVSHRSLAIAAALVCLALTAGTASADTSVSSSGTVGPHHLRDTNATPGTKCLYGEGGGSGEEVLDQLAVKPPVMRAVNKTGARDKQRVGWRVQVQRRSGAAAFVTIAQSAVQKAWAWDDTAASFTKRTVSVTSLYGADFRVHVQMFWYAADGTTVTGQAIHEVDWYRKIAHSTSGTHNETLHNFCGDFYVE